MSQIVWKWNNKLPRLVYLLNMTGNEIMFYV